MIIGFCGAIQAGKSTCANMLCEGYDGYKQYSMGDEIKRFCTINHPDIAMIEFGWTGKDWSGPKTERGRKILQEEGQSERYNDPDVWLNKVKEQIDRDNPEVALISDCRNINECEYVKDNGFLVYVNREEKEQDQIDNYLKIEDIHISECSWRMWIVKNCSFMCPLKSINPYTILTMIDNNDSLVMLKDHIAELDYQISRILKINQLVGNR